MSSPSDKPGRTKNIALIVIAVLLTIFATQNIQSININILFWDLNIALILLIAIVFICGLIAGYIIHAVKSKKSDKAGAQDTQDKGKKKKKGLFGKKKTTEQKEQSAGNSDAV